MFAAWLDDTILPALENDEVLLRLMAVKALGLFCLLDIAEARHYLPVLVQVKILVAQHS